MGKRAAVIEKDKKRRLTRNRLKAEGIELARRFKFLHLIEELPSAAREAILCTRVAPPVVLFSPSVTDEKHKRDMQTAVERFLTLYRLRTEEESDPTLSPQEFFCIMNGFLRGIRRIPITAIRTDSLIDKVRHLGHEISDWIRVINDVAWRELMVEINITCLVASRIDKVMYSVEFGKPPRRDDGHCGEIIISATPAQSRSLLIDSKKRIVFLLQPYCSIAEIAEPIKVRGELFGQAPGTTLQVYMQKHAMKRLRDRLPPNAAAADAFVGLTFKSELEIVRQSDNTSYLIAFYYAGCKLGYFGARVISGYLVLHTFVFLTMSQTPEGHKLYNLLRLTKGDMEWNRLHDMKTFVESDLFDDKVLGPALIASGCGGLKKYRETFVTLTDDNRMSVAEDLRRYLQIDPRRERILMERSREMEQEVSV